MRTNNFLSLSLTVVLLSGKIPLGLNKREGGGKFSLAVFTRKITCCKCRSGRSVIFGMRSYFLYLKNVSNYVGLEEKPFFDISSYRLPNLKLAMSPINRSLE